MARTIILNNVTINKWTVDLSRQCVEITYDIVDDDGYPWITGDATFWETIPELKDPLDNVVPTPDNWYQLPEDHALQLIALTEDAKTAIMARVLL